MVPYFHVEEERTNGNTVSNKEAENMKETKLFINKKCTSEASTSIIPRPKKLGGIQSREVIIRRSDPPKKSSTPCRNAL